MSDQTVEKMARALFDEWIRLHPFPPLPPGWGWEETNKANWRSMALVALKAMREPTEVMHDAARDWSSAKYGKAIGLDASDGCFKAMIDAAIAEVEGQA